VIVFKCPKCHGVCPANEYHAYGRHEDCAMSDATGNVSRQIPAHALAMRRGPYKARKKAEDASQDNPNSPND
jgi:hypothetical protein